MPLVDLTVEQTYFRPVIDCIKVSADAIAKTAQQLDPDQVDHAVQILARCTGKVILIGVGKSGLIGRKIAATLTSTGTTAVYLHPGDALHGDLGIATADDAAILLSNSGETDELTALLPYLQQRQVPMIAIVGNVTSTLAQRADAVLNASVDKEACPLNLAPTTSTAVALAIGDAIAMTLMQLKGLTPEDFAINHPAGRLGKRLTLRVHDLMHSGPENPVIALDAPWLDIVAGITRGGLGAVNVIDAEGQLQGLITDGDLRRTLQKIEPTELAGLTSQTVMTPHPETTTPDQLAYSALQTMENRASQISVLPVVDAANRCVGLLRLHDIVRSGLS
ncbi:MAG: KpsF/GutQ family sugar-phosphate isomerase [Cyanobacteria bacterium J06554_6]